VSHVALTHVKQSPVDNATSIRFNGAGNASLDHAFIVFLAAERVTLSEGDSLCADPADPGNPVSQTGTGIEVAERFRIWKLDNSIHQFFGDVATGLRRQLTSSVDGVRLERLRLTP
jgi:hypothetical protein